MGKRSLLYVFDDVNYPSGAQMVTAAQIRAIQSDFSITVFSLTSPKPETKKQFGNVEWITVPPQTKVACYGTPASQVLKNPECTFSQKAARIWFALLGKVGRQDAAMERALQVQFAKSFEAFDVVCVVSEASRMRSMVAGLEHPKKVQWIHTDYSLWSQFSDWTRQVTRNDAHLYAYFDRIVCLSECNRKGFVDKLPTLAEKTVVLKNVLPVEQITARAEEPLTVQLPSKQQKWLLTIGRLEQEKAMDQLLELSARLKRIADFRWFIVGDGPQREELERQCRRLGLEQTVLFTGQMENPYPLLKKADVFVLLSRYEGMPVTIEEAKILGIPVIATAVGGIPEQIREGVNGRLIYGNAEDAFPVLKEFLENDLEIEPVPERDEYARAIQEVKQMFMTV